MKKHIDWGAIALSIGVMVIYLSSIFAIWYYPKKLEYGLIAIWEYPIFILAIIMFASLTLIGVIGLFAELVNLFYHNGEDKKQ